MISSHLMSPEQFVCTQITMNKSEDIHLMAEICSWKDRLVPTIFKLSEVKVNENTNIVGTMLT